jgi:soluble lytic murein transglycosylase-like protein
VSDRILSAADVAAVVERARLSVRATTGVDVPAELVLAIIERESYPTFNARSYRREPNGLESFGLMQILVTTARDLGFTGAPLDLFDPYTGVLWGTRYLAKQLKRYGGDLTKAVAAYNAGTARPDGKGGYVTAPGYVDFVLGRVRYWLAQAAAHPVAPLAALALVTLGTLWILRGNK